MSRCCRRVATSVLFSLGLQQVSNLVSPFCFPDQNANGDWNATKFDILFPLEISYIHMAVQFEVLQNLDKICNLSLNILFIVSLYGVSLSHAF